MHRIGSLCLALLFAAGCTSGQNLGVEALGTVGQPPRNDGSCDKGLVVCNGLCTDVANDAKNCGACATACGNMVACHMGACDNACGAEGQACCPATDAGDGCGNGLQCANGKCQKANQNMCGMCAAPHATTGCVMGACAIQSCDAGFADCDGNYANGCETSVAGDANNCGGCGVACNGLQCVNGVCQGNNMCGMCAAPHANAGCVNGACGILSCNAGYADCDANYNDGCEVLVASDANNCGGCGIACNGFPCVNGACQLNNMCGMCKVPNANAGCIMGVCGILSCDQNFVDCDKVYANGCEVNRASDPNNCGGCGIVCNGVCVGGMCQQNNLCGMCAAPNAVTACVNGACAIAQCNAGWADCDANYNDGCETNVLSDRNNCGACGTACMNLCIMGLCK